MHPFRREPAAKVFVVIVNERFAEIVFIRQKFSRVEEDSKIVK